MILVTGATGFIGRQLITRLVLRREKLKVLVRPETLGRTLRAPQIEAVVGDIADPITVCSAVKGCDVVIHLAALRARWCRKRSEFERVNVSGTRTVLEAALEQEVQKVLHVSTAMVLGPSLEACRSEADHGSINSFVSEYQRTKFLADLEAKRLSEKGLPLIILFPSTAYGPSRVPEESPVTDISLAFAQGRLVPFIGKGDRRRNLVYVEDVVDGLLLALEKGKPGSSYVLGGDNVSQIELLTSLSELTGRPVPKWHAPLWMARAIGLIFEMKAQVSEAYPPITRDTVNILSKEWMVTSEKAKKELGYQPMPLKDGLGRTLEACLGRMGSVDRV